MSIACGVLVIIFLLVMIVFMDKKHVISNTTKSGDGITVPAEAETEAVG